MKHEAMDLKTSAGTPGAWARSCGAPAGSWSGACSAAPGCAPAAPLRIFLLRLFGARIGEGVLVCAGVKVLMPWNLHIGDYTAIGEGVEIYNYRPGPHRQELLRLAAGLAVHRHPRLQRAQLSR